MKNDDFKKSVRVIARVLHNVTLLKDGIYGRLWIY